MKRIFAVLASALSFFSLACQSAQAESFPSSDAFNGFYAGVGAGVSQTQADNNFDTSAIYGRPPTFVFRKGSSNFSSISYYENATAGNIHLGYGHALWQTPLFLALEILGNFTQHDDMNPSTGITIAELGNNDYTANFKNAMDVQLRNAEFGIDLKPGVFLTPTTLLYARIGAAFNEIKLNSNVQLAVNDLNNPTLNNRNFSLASADNEHVTGLRLGGGLEKKLTPHWGIGLDYIYTNYGDVTARAVTNVQAGTILLPQAFISHTNADLSSQTALLNVNYYFNPSDDSTIYCFDPCTAAIFDGFYLGAAGGVVQNLADTEVNTLANTIFGGLLNTGVLGIQQNIDLKKDSGIFAGYLGYGRLLPAAPYLYLGGDIFLNLANHDVSASMNASDTTDNSRFDRFLTSHTSTDLNDWEGGADLRPGILLSSQTLLYGRVGVAINKLKINNHNLFQLVDLAPSGSSFDLVIPSTLSSLATKTVAGLRLGGGLEEYLGKGFSVNADYIYTYYGKISTNGVGPVLGENTSTNTITVLANGFTSHAEAKLQNQAVMLGINYHFGWQNKVSAI